jgi:virginiamycin B lyase
MTKQSEVARASGISGIWGSTAPCGRGSVSGLCGINASFEPRPKEAAHGRGFAQTPKRALCFAPLIVLATVVAFAQDPPPPPAQPDAARKRTPPPPKPGVATPGVRREMSALKPAAVFPAEGTPDWQVITDDAVWVTNGPKNTIHRLDIKSNTVTAVITVGKRPCSGLAAGFGSIWVPNCGDKTLSRIDMKTNEVTATLPIPPAESEGGIAASADAVWLVTDKKGVLSRIDPKTNKVAAEIEIAAGSAGVTFGEGSVWVSTPEKNLLTRVDPKTNAVTATIEVGPKPRFLTTGAGSAWTLNQGDGTVSRVDAKTGKLIANIPVGIPGTGGELAFGDGHVWATVFQVPISEIDPATNSVVKQWFGPGGDSIRVGHGSVWLSNLRDGNVWRISLPLQ